MGQCIARAGNCKRRLLGDFAAFFEPIYFEKQKKTVEIPAVRALRFYLVFLQRAFCNSRLQQGDDLFCMSQSD
jgi:hypothetical protein